MNHEESAPTSMNLGRDRARLGPIQVQWHQGLTLRLKRFMDVGNRRTLDEIGRKEYASSDGNRLVCRLSMMSEIRVITNWRNQIMNADVEGVWKHMGDLGLGALAHANRHAAYAATENHRWPELSVLQAAHAAELLIKARIAQEHPLLIFEHFPRSTKVEDTNLGIKDLFEQGRTVQWSDLPERLWATTGMLIPNQDRFDAFGKLRNGIQHFAPAPRKVDVAESTLRFVFEVIDPFIHECWGLFAVDYHEDYDPYIYFVNALISREILFLVSQEAAECYQDWSVDWSNVEKSYKNEMEIRIKKALKLFKTISHCN